MPSEMPARKAPLHPALVLAVGALLPGMGQVLNNNATRAIIFVFFMISLGIVSYHLTTPAQSFLGRHAGGVFIYVIALVDAYRIARLRRDLFAMDARVPPAGRATGKHRCNASASFLPASFLVIKFIELYS